MLQNAPPTFSTDKDQVIGIMAGGYGAIIDAMEGGAEDNIEAGKTDLKSVNLTKTDTVVGITASGNTPYVLGGAIEYANSRGATTIGLSCNKNSKLPKLAKIPITPIVGPEVITGSTRLKAGTAQKNGFKYAYHCFYDRNRKSIWKFNGGFKSI